MKSIYICSFTLILSVIFFLSSCKEERKEMRPITYIGSYSRDFNDLNELHLEAAKRLGVEPVASREEAEHLKQKLVEIKDTDYYIIDKLTHSIPYLVPEAETLLLAIGKNFRDSLVSHHAPLYKLKITSITRTREDIEKLRKRNYNSAENSAHEYGTTIDVSWSKYIQVDEKDAVTLDDGELKKLLASVLRDLQKQEKCYVKHERKQGCFHITAR